MKRKNQLSDLCISRYQITDNLATLLIYKRMLSCYNNIISDRSGEAQIAGRIVRKAIKNVVPPSMLLKVFWKGEFCFVLEICVEKATETVKKAAETVKKVCRNCKKTC